METVYNKSLLQETVPRLRWREVVAFIYSAAPYGKFLFVFPVRERFWQKQR